MSETYGRVLIKASEKLMSDIVSEGHYIGWNTISTLFKEAGIESLKDAHEMLIAYVGDCFSSEGTKRENGFIEISTFGQNWKHMMQALTNKGSHVEAYGFTITEHGLYELYCLGPQGQRYLGSVTEDWSLNMPAEVKAMFSDCFTSEEAEDENNLKREKSSRQVNKKGIKYSPSKTTIIHVEFYPKEQQALDNALVAFHRIMDLREAKPDEVFKILLSVALEDCETEDLFGFSKTDSPIWQGDFVSLCKDLSFVIPKGRTLILGFDLFERNLIGETVDKAYVEETIEENRSFNDECDLWGTESEEPVDADKVSLLLHGREYSTPIASLIDDYLTVAGVKYVEMKFRHNTLGTKHEVRGAAGEEGLYDVDLTDLSKDPHILTTF